MRTALGLPGAPPAGAPLPADRNAPRSVWPSGQETVVAFHV